MNIENFKNAMSAAGIDPPPTITPDGNLHRFHIEGDRPRTQNGYLVLHADPPAGAFGCWKRDIKETWTAKEYRTLTDAEKASHRANLEAQKRQREAEQKRISAECCKRATELWNEAKPAPAGHDYLQRKKVKPSGAKIHKGRLVIPLRDTAGKLRGLQFIDADGSKRFLTGTAKAGHYFGIGGKPSSVLYLAEGFATAASIHEATDAPCACCFDAGNLQPVAEALRAKYPNIKLIICGDDDRATEGNPGKTKATAASKAVDGLLTLPIFHEATGTDFNDLATVAGLVEVKQQIENAALVGLTEEDTTNQDQGDKNTPSRKITVINIEDFLALEIPHRGHIMEPIIPQQGLAMIFAPRGIGKTHLSLGIAHAVSSGSEFLKWSAPEAKGVLLLDGEMPAKTLQERLARIVLSNEKEPTAPLRIVTPDLQESGMLNLSSTEDQADLEQYLDGVELIIIDNLSTLCRSGRENEAESWLPVQAWSLQQRAAGRSVLFIHHSGKNGEQRGTSRREDVLDTVLKLKLPGDYTPDRGANFEVHFVKSRGVFGDETKPFEAQLTVTPDGRDEWAIKSLELSTAEKVADLLNEGIPQQEIAELLDVSKGYVSKSKKRAQELGLLV